MTAARLFRFSAAFHGAVTSPPELLEATDPRLSLSLSLTVSILPPSPSVMAFKCKAVSELDKANAELCNANAALERGQVEMANRM
jgi:hypothetical protein